MKRIIITLAGVAMLAGCGFNPVTGLPDLDDNDTGRPGCSEGYVATHNAAGEPLCVAELYVTPGPVAFDDPTTCPGGYYQGVCL